MRALFFGIVFSVFFAAGAAFSASVLDRESPQVPAVSSEESASKPITVRASDVHEAGLPVTLRISSLKVDASIEGVGLTSDGAMGTPSDWWVVSWFRHGPRPGDTGSAVIAGHYDADEGPAVFVYLGRLKEGDEVEVTDDAGVTRVFAVERTEAYDEDAVPMEEIFAQSDDMRLNLVTCDGVWDEATQAYSKRLVVFTRLVGTRTIEGADAV